MRNPSAAHCLYAKLLEKQDRNSPDNKKEWEKCKDLLQLRLTEEQINTEEYRWFYEAKEKRQKQ
ncbi:MAG: hypothetical protein AB4372_17495 [Xenococcus sp. (in: cyanobacteria)]